MLECRYRYTSADNFVLSYFLINLPLVRWSACGISLHQPTFRGSIFSSNLPLLAAKGLDDSIEVWNLPTGTLQNKLRDRTHTFCNMPFSPDSQVLAYQTASGAINLWDTTIRSPQPILEGHSLYVDIIVCSPDGNAVVSSSRDETIRLWDAVTGSCLRTLATPGVARQQALRNRIL